MHRRLARLLALAALATLLPLRLVAVGAESPTPPASSSSPAVTESAPVIAIKVTDAGFEPRQIKVRRGRPTTLAFTRVSDRTCITAIDIPDEDVKGLELPLHRTVTVTITPKRKGVEPFHCSAMGMGRGKIVVEE